MEFLGESIHQAAQKAVSDLARDDAQGGVIAVDDEGNGKFLVLLYRFAPCLYSRKGGS